MRATPLLLCVPGFFLAGCLTLPQITEAVSSEPAGLAYRVPEPACPGAKASLARIRRDLAAIRGSNRLTLEQRGRPALVMAEATAIAMGDPQSDMGKIVAAMLDPESQASEGGASISRHGLRREMQAAHEASQEKAFTAAGMGAYEVFERYFELYFRKGRFVDASLSEADAIARLTQDFRNALHLGDDAALPPDQQKILDDAAQALVKKLCASAPCKLLKAQDDVAFVNRAGQKFGFPVVTFVVKPGTAKGYELTKIDEVQVVGDLTRVFWEAAFDMASARANLPLLADAKSTGCANQLVPSFICVAPDKKDAQEALGELNLIADRTEGVAGYAASLLVRGAFFLALDNEALAKLVQTSVSVSARKTAELVVAANRKHCGVQGAPSYRTVSFTLAK